MKKLKTTDDLLNDRTLFSAEEATKIRKSVKKEVAKIHGGKRAGAGRKPSIVGCLRSKQVKVTEGTKEAIQYAYEIGIAINIEDIKLLQYIREHNLTLSKLQKA